MTTVEAPAPRARTAGSARAHRAEAYRPGRHVRVDAGVRTLTTLAPTAAIGLPAYWWAVDGGLHDLISGATAFTSLGRLTGLVASVLLLVQVLLMARIPVVERAWGQDRLTRLHRIVGFTSFTLLMAHIALISVGYAAGSLLQAPGMWWTLTLNSPGMLLATAGTLFLCLVVATSIRAARRRLRYESWHLLHLYAYLGAGLVLPHQLWTGAQFLNRPGATVFWWSLWGAAAGAVVLWRIALPLARSVRHDLRVTSVVRESEDTVSVYVTGRRLDRLRTLPGQYFHWRFLQGSGWTRANPYSISSAPDGRSLRVTAQVVGDGSRRLAQVRPGTRVLAEGPYGRLTERARTRPRVLLIGAGSGLGPIRSLAEGLDYAPGQAMLLARGHDAVPFADELEALTQERGLEVGVLAGPRRAADSWLPSLPGLPAQIDDARAVLGWVPDLRDRDVYVCGPDAWMDVVRRSLLAAGLPPAQFHHESFSW